MIRSCVPAPEAIDLAEEVDRRRPGHGLPQRPANAKVVVGLRPSRLSQGWADAPRQDGPPPVQLHRKGGHIPQLRFAAEVARLDNMNGDIEALADRLAGICSWAYIAHRSDWLREPAKWAERTRGVEARLVRRAPRTPDAALRRPPHCGAGPRHRRARGRRVAGYGCRRRRSQRAGANRPSAGLRLSGRSVSPAGRQAPAPRRGRAPPGRRARPPRQSAWSTADHSISSSRSRITAVLRSLGKGHVLARLAPGRSLLEPALRTARALDRLSAPTRAALRERLETLVDAQIEPYLRPLKSSPRPRPIRQLARVRALAAMLADAGGVLPRKAALERHRPSRTGRPPGAPRAPVRLGPLDVYLPLVLKPVAQHWRAALIAVRPGQPMPALPPAGRPR